MSRFMMMQVAVFVGLFAAVSQAEVLKVPSDFATIQEVPLLFDALITRLESSRRDATTQARSNQLRRFVKRMRKARDQLHKLL